MPVKQRKLRTRKKARIETPVERAMREHYENASEEDLAEERALVQALAQVTNEIDWDKELGRFE
jgi:hypothetical protein